MPLSALVLSAVAVLSGCVAPEARAGGPPIYLSCPSDAPDFCQALESGLAEAAPGRLTRAGAGDAGLQITVDFTRVSPAQVEARLLWRSPGEADFTTGPLVTGSVVDAPVLDSTALGNLARALLQVTALPL